MVQMIAILSDSLLSDEDFSSKALAYNFHTNV